MSDPKRCGAEPTDAELDRLAQALEDAVEMVRKVANSVGEVVHFYDVDEIERAKAIIEIIDAAAAK